MATTGVSFYSSTWVQSMVELSLTTERQPLQRLQSQRDSLQTRKGIYEDISSKIGALQSAITSLKGTGNVFENKAVTVKNNTDVTAAAVSVSGTSAVTGSYSLNVTKLAQSHQIGSAQQAQSDVALNLSGTFVLGGATSRSVNGNVGSGNPVSGFGTGSIRASETELGSRNYSVEFRQDGTTWQFRVVDDNGKAVRIDNAADTGTDMTANWQNFDQVKNTTFDTGRGLTISFTDANPTQKLFGNTGIANAEYTAQGANITVAATDSLNEIRTKINSATFADGNQVQATVVDRKLVLTGTRTGANAAIKLIDSSYSEGVNNGVLAGLGIGVNQSGSLTNLAANQLRAVQNAEFTLNNISISRSQNTGLKDLVQGLSFDLLGESSATITVSDDQTKLEDSVKKLLEQANGLMSYIKEKTEAKSSSKDAKGNPTYTPPALGQDGTMRSLRQDIASDLMQSHTSVIGDAPKYLSQIGITVGSSGSFELNSTVLKTAIENNTAGVKSLFDNVLGRLETRLKSYVDGSQAIVKSKQTGVGDEIKLLNDRISQYQARLKMRETALSNQYSAIQTQLLDMTYQFQSVQAIGGTINQQY
ncbi:MAG: flagellar filament capping protein FliD [Anaerolineales bacterium]|nr:flagellar filament capping protein FliD [Anaerolineales bacterium]